MVRTYRGRTEAEQLAFNEERRRKAREARERKASDSYAAEDFPDLEELKAEINVEKVEIPQLSWKDRLLSKFKKEEDEEEESKKKAPTKFEKEHTEKSEKLISHILPMTVSALVALYAEKLFSEEYKACAPKKEELATILLPFFSIISRHVGIEGKASQDAIDMGAMVLASVTIGTRMLMTAESIRKEQNKNAATTNVRDIRTGRNYQTEDTGTIRHHNVENGNERPNGGTADGPGQTMAGNDGEWEASQVAQLLARDTLGRRQMGLAPRNLPEAN